MNTYQMSHARKVFNLFKQVFQLQTSEKHKIEFIYLFILVHVLYQTYGKHDKIKEFPYLGWESNTHKRFSTYYYLDWDTWNIVFANTTYYSYVHKI